MTIQEAIEKVINLAKGEVGYKAESYKHTKYTAYLDAIGNFYNGKKQWQGGGADWCDIFVDYLFVKTFGATTGRNMLYQPLKSTGAGCKFSAQFYRNNKAFTKVPQKGAQIFYGPAGNESHTGIVYDVDASYVYTIEGNIGGGNGKVGKKKLLKTNTNIVGYGIPNWKLVADSKKEFEPYKMGIDISYHQGNYDLAKAKKEGATFVIIKGGGGNDGLYVDSQFANNYKKAKALNMPVGCYWYSKALTPKDAIKEAEFFYNKCLKGKQFELPIYIDVEEKAQLKLGKKKLTDIIITWLDKVYSYGYWVGIYSSASYFKTYIDDNRLKKYCHWIASWNKNKPSYTPQNAFGVWQYGGDSNPIRSNIVAGKVVDQDYLLIDYEPLIKAKGLNGWKAPKPETKPVATKPKEVTYKVKAGDSLSSIARKYGTTVSALAKKNNIKNVNLIYVGQVLKI